MAPNRIVCLKEFAAVPTFKAAPESAEDRHDARLASFKLCLKQGAADVMTAPEARASVRTLRAAAFTDAEIRSFAKEVGAPVEDMVAYQLDHPEVMKLEDKNFGPSLQWSIKTSHNFLNPPSPINLAKISSANAEARDVIDTLVGMLGFNILEIETGLRELSDGVPAASVQALQAEVKRRKAAALKATRLPLHVAPFTMGPSSFTGGNWALGGLDAPVPRSATEAQSDLRAQMQRIEAAKQAEQQGSSSRNIPLQRGW